MSFYVVYSIRLKDGPKLLTLIHTSVQVAEKNENMLKKHWRLIVIRQKTLYLYRLPKNYI